MYFCICIFAKSLYFSVFAFPGSLTWQRVGDRSGVLASNNSTSPDGIKSESKRWRLGCFIFLFNQNISILKVSYYHLFQDMDWKLTSKNPITYVRRFKFNSETQNLDLLIVLICFLLIIRVDIYNKIKASVQQRSHR